MFKGKKGAAVTWIAFLVVIFLVGIVYIIMSEPWTILYNTFTTNLTADQLEVSNKINNMWNLWPLLFIVVAAIITLWKLLKDEPDTGGL